MFLFTGIFLLSSKGEKTTNTKYFCSPHFYLLECRRVKIRRLHLRTNGSWLSFPWAWTVGIWLLGMDWAGIIAGHGSEDRQAPGSAPRSRSPRSHSPDTPAAGGFSGWGWCECKATAVCFLSHLNEQLRDRETFPVNTITASAREPGLRVIFPMEGNCYLISEDFIRLVFKRLPLTGTEMTWRLNRKERSFTLSWCWRFLGGIGKKGRKTWLFQRVLCAGGKRGRQRNKEAQRCGEVGSMVGGFLMRTRKPTGLWWVTRSPLVGREDRCIPNLRGCGPEVPRKLSCSERGPGYFHLCNVLCA